MAELAKKMQNRVATICNKEAEEERTAVREGKKAGGDDQVPGDDGQFWLLFVKYVLFSVPKEDVPFSIAPRKE